MRLRSEADVQEFLKVVESCEGGVYLQSPEGDIFNLKSSLSRYIAVGQLIEEQGDDLELFRRLVTLLDDVDDVQNIYHNVSNLNA